MRAGWACWKLRGSAGDDVMLSSAMTELGNGYTCKTLWSHALLGRRNYGTHFCSITTILITKGNLASRARAV